SLRDRPEDIGPLVRHFVGRFGEARVRAVDPRAIELLRGHPWPGNVRELRNTVYQALVYKRAGDVLLPSDFRSLLERPPSERPLIDPAAVASAIDAGRFNLRRAVAALETEAVRAALARAGGRVAEAARLLGEVGRGRASDPGGTLRAMM